MQNDLKVLITNSFTYINMINYLVLSKRNSICDFLTPTYIKEDTKQNSFI